MESAPFEDRRLISKLDQVGGRRLLRHRLLLYPRGFECVGAVSVDPQFHDAPVTKCVDEHASRLDLDSVAPPEPGWFGTATYTPRSMNASGETAIRSHAS